MKKKRQVTLADLVAGYTGDGPEDAVDDAEELGSALSPKFSAKASKELMKAPKSEKRDSAMASVRGYRREVSDINSELHKPTYKSFQDALKRAKENEPEDKPGFVRRAANFVDTPHRELVRRPIARLAGIDPKAADESGTFHAELRKKYGDNTFHNPLNPLPKGMGRDFVDDISMDMVTDPLNAIGIGEGGRAIKAVEGLVGAGHSAIPAVKNIMATTGGMEKFQKVKEALEGAGVAPEKIAKTFGEAGEFFGNKGLAIKNATLGGILKGAGAEKVGSALERGIPLLPGYVESKAVQGLARPITNVMEAAKTKEGREGLDSVASVAKEAFVPLEKRRGLFDITQRANERQSLSRMARATEEMTKRSILEKAVPIKQWADKNPKRAEEIIRFHIDPADQTQYAATQLTGEEKAWADSLESLFKEHEGFIQQLGLPLGKNKVSGRYFPRVYDKGGQGGLDILQALFASNPNRKAGLPTGARIFRERTADIPLGSPAAPPATTDPSKVLAGYARQVSAAKGYKQLEGSLEKAFGPGDKEAERFLASQYDQHHRQLEQALRRLKGEESPVQALGRKTVGLYDDASRWWKKWTTQHFPGYHIANEVGDTGMMYQSGMNNPVKWLARSEDLIQKARGGDQAALDLLKEAQGFGIGHGAVDRAGGITGYADDLAELEQMAGGHANGVGGASGLLNKAPAAAHLNSKTAEAWDLRSRLAAYLRAKDSGLSPRDAADASFRALLDYGRRGEMDWLIKRVFPFTQWQRQAPFAAARSIAENPGRFNTVTHALSDVGADEKHHGTLPTWAEDKSLYVRVPDAGRAVFDKTAKAVGAERVLGDLHLPARYGPQEALSPVGGPGSGGEAGNLVRGVLGSANPFLKFPLQEMLSQMEGKPDLLTGRKADRAFEGQGLAGSAGRLALEVGVPRLAVPFVNAASRELGGPVNLAGRFRKNGPDKRGLTLKDLIGISGFKPIETNAATTLNNLRDSQTFKDLQRRTENSKKAAKERKKKGKKK